MPQALRPQDCPSFAWNAIAGFLDLQMLGRVAVSCTQLRDSMHSSDSWEANTYCRENAALMRTRRIAVNAAHAVLRKFAWLSLAIYTAQLLLLGAPLHAPFVAMALVWLRVAGVVPQVQWALVVQPFTMLPLAHSLDQLLMKWAKKQWDALLVARLNGVGWPNVADAVLLELHRHPLHGDMDTLISFVVTGAQALGAIAITLLPVVDFDAGTPFRVFDSLWLADEPADQPDVYAFHADTTSAFLRATVSRAAPPVCAATPVLIFSSALGSATRAITSAVDLPGPHGIVLLQTLAVILLLRYSRSMLTLRASAAAIAAPSIIQATCGVIWAFMSPAENSPASLLFGVDVLLCWIADMVLAAMLVWSLLPHLLLWFAVLPTLVVRYPDTLFGRDAFLWVPLLWAVGAAVLTGFGAASHPSLFVLGIRLTLVLLTTAALLTTAILSVHLKGNPTLTRNGPAYVAFCSAAAAANVCWMIWAGLAFGSPVALLHAGPPQVLAAHVAFSALLVFWLLATVLLFLHPDHTAKLSYAWHAVFWRVRHVGRVHWRHTEAGEIAVLSVAKPE